MKKIYFVAFAMLFYFHLNAQTCPNSIKTSAGSTPSTPIFVLNNGQGCTGWPATIMVDGSLTYNFVSCSGVNLKYAIDSGTPPSDYAMTVDFGGGTLCAYDAIGKPTTLSSNKFDLSEVSLSPNPSSRLININLGASNTVEKLSLFSITGQLVYQATNQKQLDVSEYTSGMYLLKVNTEKGVFTKRIIKI